MIMQMRHAVMLLVTVVLTLLPAAHGSAQVVQFLVHADEKTDITRLFPGAYVDFTWNGIYVVSIWTTEPESLIRSIRQTLAENTNVVQSLVLPYTLEVSTQKWLASNLVWVALLVLIFISGCACGGGLVLQCFNARRAIYRPQRMSHRILKPTMTEPQGVFTDLSDIAEGYYYWMKNEIAGSWLDFKRSKGWTIHASDRWTVHHATDNDDDEKVSNQKTNPNSPYSRV